MTTFIEPANVVKNYNYTGNSFLPHTVIIPLTQEFKKNCKPLVKKGDKVKEGEIIAALDNSSFIHSSVPGVVEDVVSCVCANGRRDFAIKISTGGKFTYLGKKLKETDSATLSPDAVLEELEKKGVVDTFEISKPVSLAQKIKAASKAENLIVRLFDEDNFRCTDSLITKFYLNQLMEGAKAAAKTFNAKSIILAVNAADENKKQILELQNDYIKVVEMNVKRYPSGTMREMLSAYNRNYKKSFGFNLSRNDIFTDASTIYEVYKAVISQIPSISKPVFFSGNCLNASCLLDVRIGTTVQEIVNQIGGFVKKPGLILINGILVGNSVPDTNIAISKYVKSVTVISKNKKTDSFIYTCVNCGSCRFICPPKLSPDLLYNNAANFRELPETIKNTALACTNCGLCNIVCPSRLPLCQTINILKENALNNKDSSKDEI